jgi:hypothetical protein
MSKAVNTIGARAPKDESQKSPQYAVLAVRSEKSMFGRAEAWVRSAGKIIRYESFEAAAAACAALNESVEAEALSYKVVSLND